MCKKSVYIQISGVQVDLWNYLDEIIQKIQNRIKWVFCIVLCIELDTLKTFNKYFLIDFYAWYIGIYLLLLFFINYLKMATKSKVELLLHLPQLVEQWVFLQNVLNVKSWRITYILFLNHKKSMFLKQLESLKWKTITVVSND